MSERRVVITGLGPVSSIGTGREAFFDALKADAVGIDKIQAFDPEEFPCQVAGEITDLKCRNYVPKSYRKSIKVMARDIELAVAGADLAIRDAGLKTKGVSDDVQVDPTRLSVNIGAGLICPDLTEIAGAFATATNDDGTFSLRKWGVEGMTNVTPLWLLKYLPNMLACHVSIIHDTQAPSNTITCAEASGHLAIGEAFRVIKRNAADACICGGAESKINPMGVLRQDLAGRLTHTANDAPAQAIKPYDKRRDGTVVAEGGSIIVVETLEQAQARNAKAYCELIGFGAAFGTADRLSPEDDGRAMAQAIKNALKDAEIESDAVDLVVGFGAGLTQHDQAEAKAIRATLGDVPVTAITSRIGNNGAGTGALAITAAAMAINEGFVPGAINFKQRDENCPINVVAESAERRIDVVATVGYSLSGGQTGALIFRRCSD